MGTVGLFQLVADPILNLLSFLGVPSTLPNVCMIIRGMVPIILPGLFGVCPQTQSFFIGLEMGVE